MANIIKDLRIDEARKIIDSMVNKTNHEFTKVLIINNVLIFSVRDTVLYITTLNAIAGEYPAIGFIYESIKTFEDSTECIIDYNILNEMQNTYNTYISMISNPCIFKDNNMRDNEEFERLLNLKNDQGLEFFKALSFNNTIIHVPMFSGFINVNKGDLVEMNVFDLLDPHLLININIYKKKFNRNISMYYRTLKLN